MWHQDIFSIEKLNSNFHSEGIIVEGLKTETLLPASLGLNPLTYYLLISWLISDKSLNLFVLHFPALEEDNAFT